MSLIGTVVCHFVHTRYGRYKMRQWMGKRLTRRERKYVWNVEHATLRRRG